MRWSLRSGEAICHLRASLAWLGLYQSAKPNATASPQSSWASATPQSMRTWSVTAMCFGVILFWVCHGDNVAMPAPAQEMLQSSLAHKVQQAELLGVALACIISVITRLRPDPFPRLGPERFGFPCGRPRQYRITWHPKKLKWNSDFASDTISKLDIGVVVAP